MKKRIFFLVGEGEYQSAETIPPFAEKIAQELGYEVVLSIGEETDPIDLRPLEDSDLLFLCVRFRNPTANQLKQLHDWFESGRPAVGIRTTSHAFSNARGWCPDYFGGHYMSHAKNTEGQIAMVAPSAANHPIVQNLSNVIEMGYGGTYNAVPLADTATPLMYGKTGELPAEPVAWINQYTPKSRIFFTSLGSSEHFQVPAFTELLRNGIKWCLGEGEEKDIYSGTTTDRLVPPPSRRPPRSAKVLFSKSPLVGWRHWDPGTSPPGMRLDKRAETTQGGKQFSDARWLANGRVLVAAPSYGDIYSNERFSEHRIHLDFQIPSEPDWVPEKFRGTGGVFISGRYEIEIRARNSASASEHQCGALSGLKGPDLDALKDGEVWQELEVEYVPQGEGGQVSVWLNGKRIHHKVDVLEPTPRGFTELPAEWGEKAPLRLQADASNIRYANIWVSD